MKAGQLLQERSGAVASRKEDEDSRPLALAMTAIRFKDGSKFDHALQALSANVNLQDLVQRTDYEKFGMSMLFGSRHGMAEVQMSGYAMLASTFMFHSYSEPSSHDWTRNILESSPPIDLLSTAVTINKNGTSKSYNHLEFVMSHVAVSKDPLLQMASQSGLILGKESLLRSCFEGLAVDLIGDRPRNTDHIHGNMSHAFGKNIMRAYEHGFGPSLEFLERQVTFDDVGQMPLRLCMPFNENSFSDQGVISVKKQLPDGKKSKWNYPVPMLAFAAKSAEFPHTALQLIEMGLDVNECNADNGVTPLHTAAFAGNDKVIARLVMEGANVHARDICGRTPEDWSELQSHPSKTDQRAEHRERYRALVDVSLATRAINELLTGRNPTSSCALP